MIVYARRHRHPAPSVARVVLALSLLLLSVLVAVLIGVGFFLRAKAGDPFMYIPGVLGIAIVAGLGAAAVADALRPQDSGLRTQDSK